MSVEQALLIAVSISVIILLIFTIVAVILVIMLVQSLQRLAKKAELAGDNLNEMIKQMGRKAAPAAISALITAAFRRWRTARNYGGNDG